VAPILREVVRTGQIEGDVSKMQRGKTNKFEVSMVVLTAKVSIICNLDKRTGTSLDPICKLGPGEISSLSLRFL